MKKKIVVEIKNIYVEGRGLYNAGHYNFDYYIWVDGRRVDYGNLDGSFSGRSREAFRKILKRGWAHTLAVQHYFG